VPLSSLNCSENGGVIKGEAHKSSKHAIHRREAVIVTQNVYASSRISSSIGITVFFLFFCLFSPQREKLSAVLMALNLKQNSIFNSLLIKMLRLLEGVHA
jgi:hypothetical protein